MNEGQVSRFSLHSFQSKCFFNEPLLVYFYTMRRILFAATAMLFMTTAIAQENQNVLPRYMTPEEAAEMRFYEHPSAEGRGLTTAPDYPELRTMAEWEEVQSLTITWAFFFPILKQIAKAAQEECEVIILSQDVNETEFYLLSNAGGVSGLDNLDNVTILDADFNSIWMRDYAANTVYGNGVDDLILVDWIYNRPRPEDDASPQVIADHLGVDLYCTTEDPIDLVNTGGNFMADGFGSGFASRLILDENAFGNPYGVSQKNESEIDQIMLDWMGLERYIKMDTLPNDEIHHIDMHMKLLDEERILVSEYPEGVSDGPQIMANIEYLISSFNSTFGTPYELTWIPAPPDNGEWPLLNENGASYKTYTNAVFVNNTILLPTYQEPYDSEAIAIWEEAMPGYNIVGIDVDNEGQDLIALSGAIHCITHAVGVEDPLLISHQALRDTDDTENDYNVEALMRHRSGIASASLYWKTDLADEYAMVPMSSVGADQWAADIPAQEAGTTVYYYVQGAANSGKTQVRPMPAPEGYWSFDVTGEVSVPVTERASFVPLFPNPASAITCVPLELKTSFEGKLSLVNSLGQEVELLHEGNFASGNSKYFFDAASHAPGLYSVVFSTPSGAIQQKVVIK